MILTAPSQAELRLVAADIKSRHGVTARVIARNLEEPDAAGDIFEELAAADLQVDILVNNAGRGFHGRWWEIPLEKDLSMIRLNIEAVLRLTKFFLPPMLQRGRGAILNTASMVGFEPSPLLTTYAATKAFVLSWSEALAVELEETPIKVTALAREPRIRTFLGRQMPSSSRYDRAAM